MVGTRNHDYRGMLVDGETAFLISRWYSLYGLMDIVFRIGMTEPVTNLEELEEMLPAFNWILRRIGRLIEKAL